MQAASVFSRYTLCLVLGLVGLVRTGNAKAAIIADTVADFSDVSQGDNGFSYGHYGLADATTGTFSTSGMTGGGGAWTGTGAFSTPIIGEKFMHPGDTSHTQRTAVRRYTVEPAGEEDINNLVPITIAGKFWDSQVTGSTIGFVTVDGIEQFSVAIPEGSSEGSGFAPFSVNVLALANSTIDFGVRPNGDFGSDGSAMSATIEATLVPEPASLVYCGIGAVGLILAARRKRFAVK